MHEQTVKHSDAATQVENILFKFLKGTLCALDGFLGFAQLMDVEVDGGEITEHMWTTPRQALARRHAGEIEVVTPTFVTLDWLRRYARVADVIADINGPVKFHTHITAVEDGNIAFYHGDVAYHSLDPSAPGHRRRANMLKSGWWWEEHDGNGNGPWTQPVDFELPNESSDK